VIYKTPDEIYGKLYHDLHVSGLWKDGKKISDAVPRKAPVDIFRDYERQKSQKDFDLKSFFKSSFKVQKNKKTNFRSIKDRSSNDHIHALWDVLRRKQDTYTDGSSLIPLPYDYIVPGGRFNEIYYWDSYFTMLGLKVHDKWGLVKNMIDNFTHLIDVIGFIPNGNRTYFMSRSQPPFYAMMVQLISEKLGPSILVHYLPQLIKEYAFWMSGSDDISEGAHMRIVKDESFTANRYYDHLSKPRMEMYYDDIHLLKSSNQEPENLFRNIRAACESGWDFSSRWFSNYRDIESIDTCNILPVDLNCLLYNLEMTIADAYGQQGDNNSQSIFLSKAEERKMMINALMWDEEEEYYFDYHFKSKSLNGCITAAGMYPLFYKIADQEQADACAETVQYFLMKEGGLVTTTNTTGQQWDAPNGWAPLQWIAIQGLRNYGHDDLAMELSRRWLRLNEQVYQESGKFVEKYNVVNMETKAGGGEYPLQDGFGWSNGVFVALKNQLKQNIV
jgi:alpha,alpha-trehalase